MIKHTSDFSHSEDLPDTLPDSMHDVLSEEGRTLTLLL